MGLFSFSVTWDHNTCLSHLPGLLWGSRIWTHVVKYKVWYPCCMSLFCRWHLKKFYWLIWSMSPQPLCMGSLKPHRDSCLKPSRYRCANKGTFKIAQQSRGKAGPGSITLNKWWSRDMSPGYLKVIKGMAFAFFLMMHLNFFYLFYFLN